MPDLSELCSELASRVEGPVYLDAKRRDLYSRAACLYRIEPAAVVRPSHGDDVVETVRFAAGHGVPVTARGAGSSVAGGALGRGVVLDLSGFRDIRMAEDDAVRVGVGVTWRELDRFLASRGRLFPVDPSSSGWCSVGGMVMTNASGPHSYRWGPTRAWLRGLEGVAAGGDRVSFPSRGAGRARNLELDLRALMAEANEDLEAERPRVLKRSSGYGLWDGVGALPILCGSEGTLVVATHVTLGTMARPRERRTALLHPGSLRHGVETILELRHQEGIGVVEMLDEATLALLRTHRPSYGGLLPASEDGVLLWIDAEADEAGAARSVLERALAAVAPRSGEARLLEPSEAGALGEMRRSVSPLLKEIGRSGRRPARFVEDGCVPPERLEDYVLGMRRLVAEAGLPPAPTFGHAGQGHLHCNPSLDLADPEDRERLADMVEAHGELCRSCGGVASGEHGDGRLRAGTLERLFPRSLPWMRRIKALFDPEGILNPEVKVVPAGRRAPAAEDGLDPRMEDLRMDSLEHRRRFEEEVLAA